jgi:hypothetical protein
VQGTCVLDTGCRGARLLVWLVLNDRVQPSFIAGVRMRNPVCHTVRVPMCARANTGRRTAAGCPADPGRRVQGVADGAIDLAFLSHGTGDLLL